MAPSLSSRNIRQTWSGTGGVPPGPPGSPGVPPLPGPEAVMVPLFSLVRSRTVRVAGRIMARREKGSPGRPSPLAPANPLDA